MPGLTILHALPRLLGPVDRWSGLDDQSSESWLVNHAVDMGFNAIWLSPFFKNSDITVERHGQKVSGSLYAMTDHFRLDGDFSTGSALEDDEHIKYFTSEAADKGITVMGDLVLNHVALDHPAVTEETTAIQDVLHTGHNIRPHFIHGNLAGISWDDDNGAARQMLFTFHRNDDFTLSVTGANDEVWDDVARINYDSPAAREFFIDGQDGQPGYWKQAIDWHLDRGFTGFRCDVAYMVPADIWSELIQHAHDKLPDVIFMAETLGDNGQANQLQNAHITVNGTKRRAFDLAMLGTYWWNFRDDWLLEENKRMQSIARFGGAAFPDNHDTPNTVARHFMDIFNQTTDEKRRDQIVSDICLRNYAVAALISNSVYMQHGYEYCRKPVSVFRDPAMPAYFDKLRTERGQKGHPLNLTSRIKAINDFRQQINQADAVIKVDDICDSRHKGILKMSCTLQHFKTGDKLGKMLIYINEKPEAGAIRIPPPEIQDTESDKRLNRLVLGHKDTEESHFYEVNDVAAFYTPLTPAADNKAGLSASGVRQAVKNRTDRPPPPAA